MAEYQDDAALTALRALDGQLARTIADLEAARARVVQLEELRRDGRTWHDIVSHEERPLVVEAVTHALENLGTVGGRFRREEAMALQREAVSITRIGKLFGVSRQRVSAILQEGARLRPVDRPTGEGPGVADEP